MKEARKQAKQEANNQRTKEKNLNGGMEEENKKEGFHPMTIKFVCPCQMAIEMDSVATRFGRHCCMVNKMNSGVVIRW
jgi:hypothetical protein